MNTRVMELFKLFKSFFIWKIVIIEFICIQAMVNVSYANNTRAEFHPLEECSLLPKIGDIGDRLEAMLKRGTYKLVKIHLEITGDAVPYTRGTLGPMLHPGSWVLTTGPAGRTMLLLRENSEEMSLGYLSLGVTTLNITVIQSPEQCLSRLTDLQAEEIVSKAILTGFANSSVALSDGAEVCSRYFNVPQTGSAKLVYKCCRLSHSNNLDCYDPEAPAWQSILIASVVVAVLIFSSKFIPNSLVKIHSDFFHYHFNPLPENRLVIRSLKVEYEHINRFGLFLTKHPILATTNFENIIKQLKHKTPMDILVESLTLSLRPKELLQYSQSPVSVLSFLWRFLFRCKLRSETSLFRDCCYSKVDAGMFCTIRWYGCLRKLMYIIFIGLLCTPWLLRVLFYYKYELEIEKQLQHAFASRNLTNIGSLASYMSPIHPLVIGIYVILAIWLICFGLQIKKFNLIVKTCMYEIKRNMTVLDLCGEITRIFLVPLEFFGIIGCLILPILAPICFIMILLEVFPILLLLLLLLLNFIFYLIVTMFPGIYTKLHSNPNVLTKFKLIVKNGNENFRKNNFIYALELLSTLMIILSLTTLVTACIYFYVEASFYTLLGIILNASYSSIYSVVWFIVYFFVCFTPAHSAYSTFCKTIHSEIRNEIDHNAIEREQEQGNRAFQVQSTKITERMKLVRGTDGVLQWNVPRVCLFLDKYHIPYIPTRMLFELAKKIDHSSCPKQLHIIYFNSLIDFIKGGLFLYFYFVVISAFGQEIAVFAISFVPLYLIIRRFLKKTHEQLTVENNMEWKKALRKALQEYRQTFAVTEINVRCSIDRPTLLGDINQAKIADLFVVEKTEEGSKYYEYFVRHKDTLTHQPDLIYI